MKTSDNNPLRTNALVKILIFTVVVFFAGKPTIKLCFQIFDEKTELCETLEEETQEEEKEIDDIEDTDKIISDFLNELSVSANQERVWFNRLHLIYSQFKPGVQIPPPEVTLHLA
ncbi:MAG: hypothetical protein HUJ25_08780 [Crocinitomicaceae bacterium]|nr:hypothetical protein [Crocinitomicaceae bacterium]